MRVNCTEDLDDSASLTGTPTITEQTTSDLTLGNKVVTSTTYTDSVTGETVAAGKAFSFTATGGTAGTAYRIRASVATDSSPAETLVYDLILTYT